MFGNTLTMAAGGGNVVLTRVNQDNYSSEYLYRSSTEQWRMRIRHTTVRKGSTSRDRHNVELVQTVFATPTAAEIVRTAYFVFEQAQNDVSIDVPETLFEYAIATSSAFLTSLAKWES